MKKFDPGTAIAAVRPHIPDPITAKRLNPNERVYTESTAKLMVLHAYLLGVQTVRDDE